MPIGKRGIIFFGLSVVALILAIISTPLALARIETDRTINGVTGHSVVTYSQWQICVKQDLARSGSTETSTQCTTEFDCATDEARAARAFSILSIVVLFMLCCGFGVLDMLLKLPVDPVGKLMLVSASLFAVSMTLISWALQVALYLNTCSGQSIKDAEGSHIGPAPILMIIACACALVAFFVAVIMRGPVEIIQTSAGPVAVQNPPEILDDAAPREPNPVANRPYANA
jgi:hypothetical protein